VARADGPSGGPYGRAPGTGKRHTGVRSRREPVGRVFFQYYLSDLPLSQSPPPA
jgi:hypothetical protein